MHSTCCPDDPCQLCRLCSLDARPNARLASGSRAFSLQVIASNIRGWSVLGPDQQPLQVGAPGCATQLARQLLLDRSSTATPRKASRDQPRSPAARGSAGGPAAERTPKRQAAHDSTSTDSRPSPSSTWKRQKTAEVAVRTPARNTPAAPQMSTGEGRAAGKTPSSTSSAGRSGKASPKQLRMKQ